MPRIRRSNRVTSQYQLDELEQRILMAATKVVFSTSAISAAAGVTSTLITVQLQDASSNTANAGAGGQVINLSTSSSGGTFVDLSNNPINSITIPAGSSSASFEYRDTVAAVPTLGVSGNALAAAVQQETISANAPTSLAFTTNPSGSLQNVASTTITVVLKDANGNIAPAPGGGSVVNLSSTSAGGTFAASANITIAAGATSASFTYKDTIVGTPTITAASSGLTSAMQQQTVYSSTTVVVKPDPAGLGSYASTPPGGQNFNIVYGSAYDWINRPANSPLPTNDWWTLILKSGFAGSLYSMPQKLFTQSSGVTVSGFTGINSVSNNIGYSGEQTISLGGNGTTFGRDALVAYSDWMVRFRMEQAQNQYVDVTAVQGSPMAWYEYNNIAPALNFGGSGTYGLFDANGVSLGSGATGFTADRFRISKGGVNFAIFAPANTVFVPSATGFTVAFAGADHYLVAATLPDATAATLDNFYQHAYAVPRTTTYNYSYSAAAGAVNTTWDVATDPLKAGASTDIIQGWLPTNYRDIVSGPSLLSGNTYPTIYGTIKSSVGHSFTIVQPTNGLNFVLPSPQQIGGTSDFDPAKMAAWFASYQLGTGADSYGGMTTLSQAAQLTLMAQQMNDPQYARLLSVLRGGVTNWLTYQTGDTKFFTAYPKDKALIAYPSAFGSEHYTDIHFHYGYLTSSAAVMAILDPSFATNYGAMATLVAKSYANWDRSDTSEPYLRTFNPWKSHSYADGLGDSLGNQGNDQESASEAVQSWQGLVLLGQALGNQAMTDAGIMGYTMETKAEMEYWLNVAHKDLNPVGYPVNRNTAINADFTRQQQTFFGNQPKYQLGIEGLPDWPSMDFLGKYNQNMQDEVDATLAAISTTDPWQALGTSDDGNNWLSVILGIQGQVNPQKAADQFARLSTLNAADANNAITGIPYYLTYANRTIGLRNFAYHLSVPIGGVYSNGANGAKTYVAYNASQSPQTIQVLDAANNVIDSFTAAARSIVTIAPFAAIDGSGILQVPGTANADTFAVSQSGSTITVTRGASSQSFDAAAVNSIVFTGLGSDDVLSYNGPVTKAVTFNGGTGNDTLNVNSGTFTFSADANAGTASLSVNVAAGAFAMFNATQHLAGLSVLGKAVLAAGSSRVLVTNTLSVSGSGALELNDNDLIVLSTPNATIRGYVKTAYNFGGWDGPRGIFSNAAKTNPNGNTMLGVLSGDEFANNNGAPTFDGQSVHANDVLVKYTYFGDVDFNGAVDSTDYNLIDFGFLTGASGWANGDVDDSGAIDSTDYNLIDFAFVSQNGIL